MLGIIPGTQAWPTALAVYVFFFHFLDKSFLFYSLFHTLCCQDRKVSEVVSDQRRDQHGTGHFGAQAQLHPKSRSSAEPLGCEKVQLVQQFRPVEKEDTVANTRCTVSYVGLFGMGVRRRAWVRGRLRH